MAVDNQVKIVLISDLVASRRIGNRSALQIESDKKNELAPSTANADSPNAKATLAAMMADLSDREED